MPNTDTSLTTTVTIYGRTYTAQPGAYVELDCSGRGEVLGSCDWWDRAEHVFPGRPEGPHRYLACTVSLTGRTLQRRAGSYFIKAQITWPGDEDRDVTSPAWLHADERAEVGHALPAADPTSMSGAWRD